VNEFDKMANGEISWPERKKRRNLNRKGLENLVKKDCIALLHRLQKTGAVCLYERRNNITLPTTDGGMVFAGVRGRADMWAVVNLQGGVYARGKHVEIECKRADGKGSLSPKQKDFRTFCMEQDIPYLVVTSAVQLAEELQRLGVNTA